MTSAPDNTWVVSIHHSDRREPDATGFVIDETRILTCAHVIRDKSEVWVAFPNPEVEDTFQVHRCKVTRFDVAQDPLLDVAVLHLDGDTPLPPGVRPAPLRWPKPTDLVGSGWSALGFPRNDPIGSFAQGTVHGAVASGYVKIDSESPDVIEKGFSGAALWSESYEAVVGIVVNEGEGNGQALTLHVVAAALPAHELRRLAEWSASAQPDEDALHAWGWRLVDDKELGRHWRPRARGVTIDSEVGFRFRGRTAALCRIVEWLDAPRPEGRVLVVTGSPGVGKSAVMGRIVTSADPALRAELPTDDSAVRATPESVACAVHAKGKTALEVAAELARAASTKLPEQLEDTVPNLRASLEERGGERFNVLVDAIDEAGTPEDARRMVTDILVPLAETCADVGAAVVAASRRADGAGDLLGAFGRAIELIDLDNPAFFAEADLVDYAMVTLQQAGSGRVVNPYADVDVAEPVAKQIAKLAQQNFLVTGLEARTRGRYDNIDVDPAAISFVPEVGATLRRYLARVEPAGDMSAEEVLTALAFAEAPGWDTELWSVAIMAIYGQSVPTDALSRFAGSAGGNFVVEESLNSSGRVFRLFHQALSDALQADRGLLEPGADTERKLATTLLTLGRGSGWGNANPYILRSLAGHAALGGCLDDLLGDTDYLLHADLLRLLPALDRASTPAGKQRAALLRHGLPAAHERDPVTRAAMLSVTEALDGVDPTFDTLGLPLPYSGKWASVKARGERLRLDGHTRGVNDVCPITIDGRQLLATASSDHTARIWDPTTGQQLHQLEGHTALITTVCPITIDGRQLLATASDDHTVRIWDPTTGHQLECHRLGANDACTINIDGQQLLATASNRVVGIWDPTTGRQLRQLKGHTDWVTTVCPIAIDGRQLLATASDDQTVRIWDATTGNNSTSSKATP